MTQGFKLGPSRVLEWDADGAYVRALKIPDEEFEDFYITTEDVLQHAELLLPCDLNTLARKALAACHPSWTEAAIKGYVEIHGGSKSALELLTIYAVAKLYVGVT